MTAMKRITFHAGIEMEADEFEQYKDNIGRLIWYALEHGDAHGEFGSYHEEGTVRVEDWEEEDE